VLKPRLGVAGSTVVFMSPVNNSTRSSELVGVDAVTGRRLWHTPAGAFQDWPAPCPDAARDICTTGSLGSDQETLALRFRASDGAQAGAVAISDMGGGREIGPDLYDPGVRAPEAMVAVSGDAVAWDNPLASVFPQESTDWGWNFIRVPAAGLFVGSVGATPLSITATKAVLNIAGGATAGFRISDGSAAWQDPGTWFECGELPCPGQGLGDGIPTMGLRLRTTGTATHELSSGTMTLSPGASVTIEGFDLATGKTTWSYDAGPDVALLDGVLPPVIGSEAVALPARSSGSEVVALNLATGKQAPVSPTAAGWCASSVQYKTQVPYPKAGGGTQYERDAFSGFEPCDASGDLLSFPAKVPSFAGITADGLTVTSDSFELAATPTLP
jgi:hypothetical protein